jgi:hypothetical protein
MSKRLQGWHNCGGSLRSDFNDFRDRRKTEVGKTLEALTWSPRVRGSKPLSNQKPQLCRAGMHAHYKISEALRWDRKFICRVEVWGDISKREPYGYSTDRSKFCGRYRKILKKVLVSDLKCALVELFSERKKKYWGQEFFALYTEQQLLQAFDRAIELAKIVEAV